MLYQSFYDSPIGKLTIVCDDTHLRGLWIAGQKYYLGKLQDEVSVDDDLEVVGLVKAWLDGYFSGRVEDIKNLPIAYEGTMFQQLVWNLLCEIPYGETTTYGDIAKQVAKQMGKKQMSAQAVGVAVGHNPISIIVPCHRVLGKDGSLTGYAGGIDLKIQLLKLEGIL